MIIIGGDYHPSDLYTAFVDTETGEQASVSWVSFSMSICVGFDQQTGGVWAISQTISDGAIERFRVKSGNRVSQKTCDDNNDNEQWEYGTDWLPS